MIFHLILLSDFCNLLIPFSNFISKIRSFSVTETHTDDGLPHTLEHLVFMGSKKYPVKGILDIIANRCLASGTNAWTAQDHTAYTLTTVFLCS